MQQMHLDAKGARKALKVATAICYDIVDDRGMRESAMGADFIIAPTNNADFGFSDQPRQQAVIARMRAIELGKSVVQVSTTAYSAAWDYLGREIVAVKPFVPGVFVAEVPLTTGNSIAAVAGPFFAAFSISIGAILCVCNVFSSERRRDMRKFCLRVK